MNYMQQVVRNFFLRMKRIFRRLKYSEKSI